MHKPIDWIRAFSWEHQVNVRAKEWLVFSSLSVIGMHAPPLQPVKTNSNVLVNIGAQDFGKNSNIKMVIMPFRRCTG
jgi:hypothetical protein